MKPQTQIETQVRHPLTSSSVNYLFHHILAGFQSSHEGLLNVKKKGMVTDQELIELLTQNSERLIRRIVEFKIVERLTCVFFAALFGYMQLTCEDLEMRRTRSSVRVKRRQETEITN